MKGFIPFGAHTVPWRRDFDLPRYRCDAGYTHVSSDY